MNRKCRKVTAAFLSCILAFLCTMAEFAHHHSPPQTNLQPENSQPLGSATQVQPGHGMLCAACAFALSHVAPAIAMQQIVAQPLVAIVLPARFVFGNTVTTLTASLRAPPALLS